MGKSSAPAAPDPYASAAAQYQYGTQAAAYNKALGSGTTVNPLGQTTQVQTGTSSTGAPIYTTTQSLTPAQQQLFNAQQGAQETLAPTGQYLASEAGRTLEQPLPNAPAQTPIQSQINTSGVSAIPGASDLAGFTNQAQQAAYQQQTQYLDPQYQQEQEQLDNQLKESGAQPGSAAYNNAMTLFDNQKQQAYQSANNNAVQQGLAEQQAIYGEGANTNQQQFGEAATEQQAANAAAAQQYGQETQGLQTQLGLEETPLQQYSALESGVGTDLPSFGLGGGGVGGSGAGGNAVSAPDIMNAFQQQYQGQLANYNAGVASQNADLGAGASLASSYLMYLAAAA
jgi:hypothetical protein